MAKKQRPSSSSSQLWTIHLLLLLFLVIRHAGAQPAIASPPRNGFNGSNLNPPSLAIIIVIVVTAFFLMGFFTIYIHQCAGGGSSTTSRSHRRGGLDPEIIDTFPTFLYSYVKDLKIGKGALECAVCLSEFEDEVTLRWLPKCDHVFHPDCIDSWLASHSTCPLCRSDLSATTTTTTPPIFSNNEQEVEADQFQNTSQSPSSLTEINNNLVNETAENSGRVRGRFRRWHTTGHASSVVVVVEEGCDDCERFTLRLPEEVRRQIVESTAEAARMKRAKSCVAERGEGSVSSRRWWGRGEDRDRDRDKWLFFSRGASVKSPKITDGEGSASARGNSTRSFVTSVTAPFDCIGSRAEVEEATATTPYTDCLPV